MYKKMKRLISGTLAFLIAFTMCLGDFTAVSASTEQGTESETRTIDVWDFSGVLESDTDLYTNHITPDFWNTQSCVESSGKFVAVDESLDITIDDLTLTYVANDRLYSNAEECTKSYSSTPYTKSSITFDDDYTSNGIYYCNGTGNEDKRCITIDNVKAGDKISVYACTSNSVNGSIHFKYLDTDVSQLDDGSISGTPSRVDFVAQYDGSYKIYTDSTSGKAMYYRVTRTPAVTVSGTLDLQGADLSGYSVIFTNDTTGQETEASLDGTRFTALLAASYSYTATFSGVAGYGFSNSSKNITTTLSQIQTGSTDNVLTVQAKQLVTFSGKIAGFDESYDVSKLAMKLVASEISNADDVEVTIHDDLSFSALLEADTDYTLEMSGVNDYLIESDAAITLNSNLEQDIHVKLKEVYEATGEFVGLPADAEVTAIQFISVDDAYTYSGTINNNGYSIKLREGSYSVNATVAGYKTNSHVVISGSNTTKDLLFVSTSTEMQSKDFVSDIYVGYSDKENNYTTVNEAIKACEAMNPQSEAERITVHIAPGTYREQIIINTPYISLVNDDSSKEVKLTWYYGIGYSYYSADTTGYYNEENAFDQYEKNTVSKWGCSTYLLSGATGFQAENITFEASFNRYVTDEEIEDGVEVAGTGNTTYDRTTYGADVASKAATERAAALCIEADEAEFSNCSFLGSQDTLYNGGTAIHSYFKNCHIEGNTDYIFGDGDAVFDGCELQWYGYTSGSVAGYLTAARPNLASYGYLFRNCTITENTDSKFTVTASYLGRPWGADAKVAFLNTKLLENDSIVSAGWTSMDGRSPENANYVEYNTTLASGEPYDTSSRVTGVTDDVSDINVTNYFGSWTPSYYSVETDETTFTTAPYLSDNGDINAPYPGHTLTACYSLGENDANDASVIHWYRVDSKGNETLIQNSTSTVSATYKLTSKDAGNYIKVVVIPETLNGVTGEAASYTMEAMVLEGYDNPGSTGDVEIGDGINIYLAGDSTVKDYSISGMYMSGLASDLGSWGEFFQSYFNDEYVNIVNYANGGRSSRSFINEGSLDAISENITEGDYLFIQFGHNDCSNGSGYLEERYVPLGIADANGIYPTTAGSLVTTPSSLVDKYGSTFYSYDCGGTYKWYLQQYIEAAKEKGATPVLVTPVSRMYYNSDGTIKSHHDSTDTTTGTQVTENDAYVTAVKQLAEEENVLCIDAFNMTKTLFETAYADDPAAADGTSAYGSLLMSSGEKTHSSKLGGYIEAGLMVQAIQELGLDIANYVQSPTSVIGKTSDGNTVFSVSKTSQLTAYETASDGTYGTTVSEYWTAYGQKLMDAIAEYNSETEVPVESETPVTSDTPSSIEAPATSEVPSTSETPVTSTVPSASTTPSQTASTKPDKPVIKTNLAFGTNGSVKVYTYNIGATAKTLKVAATGKNITYQWFYNTKNSYTGATKISGATKKTYTPSSKKTGSIYYFCKISANDSTKDIKKVTVYSKKVKVTIKRPVTKITASKSSITLKAGKSTKLKVTVLPKTATNKSVTFKSSNTKYATVSSTGVVKAKKAGIGKTITITIRSKDNSKIVKKVKVKIKK